jgi:hypothetical protein
MSFSDEKRRAWLEAERERERQPEIIIRPAPTISITSKTRQALR